MQSKDRENRGADGSDLRIRGVATLGNQSPLVVVDGVPRDFSRIDPNMIEDITILKDAAAVAPYGMAGANGVVLVTTKREKAVPRYFHTMDISVFRTRPASLTRLIRMNML